jgi:transcriptional regulator with XRE-family HTH domain
MKEIEMSDSTCIILARLMKEQNISQVDLAKATGVTQSTISRILKPDSPNGIKLPSDAQVRRLAGFLRVSTDQLRGYQVIRSENSVETTDPTSMINQLLEINGDPRVVDSLTRILAHFCRGRISAADAKMVEDLVSRLAKPLRATAVRRVQSA